MDAQPGIRVLIVDDHPMVREGLRSMLGSTGVDIVGEAGSGAQALVEAADRRPDVVLLDLELPDMDGLAVLRQIKQHQPKLPVLVVTMHQDPDRVRQAIRAGASGYVLKGVGRAELLASISAVRSGESVFDPGLVKAALEGQSPSLRADRGEFSTIELDLLRLIAAGLTNRQIGQRLRWSVATVKKYIQRVLEKLEVSDRTQAAVVAVRRGLLD
ncbi:MAG TPA: response regulator transcription factor [Candidatus Methylomirabilis sp.]|nr:response regulator transcription factor [Candidatus Methylomirabilis sp.]